MRKHQLIFVFVLAACCAVCAAAQTSLVSDGLSRINSQVDVAYDPLSGSALVVWCQRSFDNPDDGVILASFILKHPTGELEINEPFQVSPDGGNHQRPRVLYLNSSHGFLIVWDDAPAELNKLRGVSGRTFARVFLPPGIRVASDIRGTLTDVIDISPADDGRSFARPRLVTVPVSEDVETVRDEIIAFGIASSTSGVQPISAWAAKLSIDNLGTVHIAESTDLPDTSAWAIDGGFIHDGLLYAVGCAGDDEGKLNTGLFMLDAELLTVESRILLVPLEQAVALSGAGSILPLEEPNDSGVFRLVAIPAGDPAVFAVESDFAENSLREYDRIGRNREEVVAEELFTFTDEDSTESSDFVLYASADGLVRYRQLKDTSGKPRGSSKTLENGEAETLLDVSYSGNGSHGYICFSRMINRRKSAVHITLIQ